MAKRIFKSTSITNEQKVNDLLECTESVGDCRVWTRAVNSDGYAHMFGNVKVHRLMHELSFGEDIRGLVIRHTCDNPKCINPDHLVKGTVLDNVQDMVDRKRHHRVLSRDIIKRVRNLLESKLLTQKEIAVICGIDARRVSDISTLKYDLEGNFVRR